MKYVIVCEEEEEPTIELPLEEDGTLLLSTLTCQFPKATGLKYKSKDTGIYRGVRFASDRFYPPPEGWETYTYSCVLFKDNKRKSDDEQYTLAKTKKMEGKKCTDLIVLNIPWRTDDEALKMYFSKFGDVVMVQVKREPDTLKSKGYAFIRFADYDAQVMCLAEQHCIDNRWCEVKIPYSKMNPEANEVRNKIHVGRLSEAVTADVLRSFFNQYGKVESIYIPRPFRSFAFVSFEDESTAQSLLGRELKINDDCVVTISAASPKSNHNQNNMNGRAQQGYGHWNTYDDGRGGMNRNRSCQNKLMPNSNQMPHEWSNYLQQQHMHASQAQAQRQFTTPDMSQNTNAMAALNIINNPSVVAAIMSAAAARAQQGDVNSGHLMPTVSSGLGGGGYMGKPDVGQNQQQSQQPQPQPQQQFLYSHIPNQNSWGY